MTQQTDPKTLMEEGWKARENYEFEKSEKLLVEAKKLFEKLGDWKNVTECLNHLAYLRKTQAFRFNQEAIKYATKSLETANEKSLDAVLCHRANSSILKYAGSYEQAEAHTRTVIDNMSKNPAARADTRTDLAVILMRRGKIDEAKREIDLAEKELEEGWEKERMPHKMVWKTKLLMTSSLINYNLGNITDAKLQVAEAYALAEEHHLKMRLEEAKELLKLFK